MTSKLARKQKKLSYKPLVGGFTDLASFRAETGLTPADMSDADAQNVIYMDAKYHVENLEKENAKLRAVTPVSTPAKHIDYDPFYTARILNDVYRPLNINSVLETERLRQKIRNEIDQERLLKLLLNRKQARSQSRTRALSRTRAQSRTQSRTRAQSRTQSQTQSRTQSQTQSRTQARTRTQHKSKSKHRK